jgi:mannose-1-phosphate guanylyltransferase/mannose-6-phosphate isomerase
MCGGAGTRLWPVSRDSLPKQFAPLLGKLSSFQETVLRLRGEGFADRPLIVASAAHRHLIESQLADIDAKADLLLEPCRRDSGPAIVAGSLWIAHHAPQSAVLVVAADHVITEPEAFRQAVRSALPAAKAGQLVTFGIAPTHPATEYGYIEPGEPVEKGAFAVARFAEKPDAATAAIYIADSYLWNSGNFLFMPEALLAEYRSFHPATVAAVEKALDHAASEAGALLLDLDAMQQAEKNSLDYAVMERTARAAVMKLACGWSDIGSWDALWSLAPKDVHGNVARGDIELLATTGCYVSSDGPLTTVLGVSDVVVVAQSDAVLVADRKRSAEVKLIVDALRKKGRSEADQHSGIRRMTINPGQRLPAQISAGRTLHWIVTSGRVKARIGGEVRELLVNAHAVVPAGTSYELENAGPEAAQVVEVQVD